MDYADHQVARERRKRSTEEIRKKTWIHFSFPNVFLPYQVISMIHEIGLLNGKIFQDFEVCNLFCWLWKMCTCFKLFKYSYIQYALFSTYYVPGTALNLGGIKIKLHYPFS